MLSCIKAPPPAQGEDQTAFFGDSPKKEEVSLFPKMFPPLPLPSMGPLRHSNFVFYLVPKI